MKAAPDKACTKCGAVKPRTAFYENGRVNGRAHCKDCTNAMRNALRRKQRAEKTPLSLEAEKERQRAYYRRRRALEKLRAGTFVGDGPCWCCRAPAVGSSPFRLCLFCGG